MKTLHILAGLAAAFATTFPLSAAEYSRYAMDSVTIPFDDDNSFGINVGGADIDLFDNADEVIPPSYALAPFQFHPRDFSLSEITSINSIRLGFRNDVNDFTDDAPVQVFYVPDSREDFGVPTTEDDEFGDCTFGSPFNCYDLTYEPSIPNGIDPGQFSTAPVLLGQIDVQAISPPALGFPLEEDFIKATVDLDNAAADSLMNRINAGQGFHLVFGAVEADKLVEIGSFNTSREGPGADVRTQLIIDASGVAAGLTKDLRHHGAIHFDSDNTSGDFYGSGNDDDFSEYGIANFQFSKDELGAAEDISDIGSIQLTLHHNDRNFADGDMFELFFTSDTADELGYDEELGYDANLTYDAELDNGLDESEYTNAPISLGTYEYTPKFGGNSDTFDLQLPEDAKRQLVASVNSGDDFHILIATADPEWDITFAGKDNDFDPGNPQLTISLGNVDPPAGLDLNGDGSVNADDAALLCAAGGDTAALLAAGGSLAGDADLNGTVEFADFLTMSSNFGQAGHFGQGDFDCNGNIEFADFLTLSSNFGVSGAAASVPEPNCCALLLGGFCLAIASRKRRS